jgi:alkanesulfonate monooxygenase SsuD/methylene tetrahydromethanopterin reductase-like flavin-dependent oxidoreductase (luciferase family)
MVEGVQVMRAMWTDSPAMFEGTYYQVRGAYCGPRPAPPPIMMLGGDGERYLLRAVAEHADWWNTVIRPVPVLRHKLSVLEQHCHDVGRDYAGIRKTITRTVYLSRSRAEAERWAAGKLESPNPPFAGEPAALVDHLHELVDLGFDVFQIVFAGFPDTTDMRLFVDEVMPAFA